MCTNGNGSGAGIFLLLLCILTGGCARNNLTEKRDDSFLPYEQATVGRVPLRGFLNARSAKLYRADELIVTPSGTNYGSVNLTGRSFHLGLATAVDHRGYFLTASHCLAKGPFKLLFFYEGQVVAATVRVVWRGDVSKGQPDLALLDAALPLEHVFEWTPDFTNGDDIVTLGLNVLGPHRVKNEALAGKIVGVTDGSEAGMPHYLSIAVAAPFLREDNGGPLAAPDGRLIGIDVNSGTLVQGNNSGPVIGTAQRPDLNWLKQLIEQDVAKQSGAKTR